MKERARTPQTRPFDVDAARRIAEDLKHCDGALLPILHALEDRFGYVDDAAVPVVAEVLNLTRADVYGVISFYHDFRRTPPSRHVVKLCRAEACQAVGAERVGEDLRSSGAALSDVTIEPVYCLGNCALGPSALVNGKLYGRLDAAKIRGLVGR
jgi:formate dehydrogenase subunit gamma